MIKDKEEREQEENFFFEQKTSQVFTWLVELTYFHGWNRGLEAAEHKKDKKSDTFYLFDYLLYSEDFNFRWYRHQGRIYLTVFEKEKKKNKLADIFIAGKRLNELLIFGYHDLSDYSSEKLEEFAKSFEELVQRFYPKANQLNGVRICSSPFHLFILGKDKPVVSHEQFPNICEKVGDKWLCADCLERYDFDPDHWVSPQGLNQKQRTEFGKLKPALRLTVLERDEYACSVCHRSPLQGQDVQLTVTYRMPLQQGGKTQPENLQTICKECLRLNNLAESETRGETPH